MITRARARQLRKMIERASASLSDTDALDAVELFPVWAAGVIYEIDVRIQHNEVLYKVRQAHTSSEIYPPGSQGTEALYAEVEKPGQGDTPDNPIPYNNNMELIEGKYYSQNNVVYICTRSTGVPVYNNLADLIGIYVDVWVEE